MADGQLRGDHIVNLGTKTVADPGFPRGGAPIFLRCQLMSVTSRHFTINKQKLQM